MISELSFENDPVFSSRVEIILPAFIPQFNTMAFQNRLNLFLQNEFPAQINYRCHFVTPGFLKELIPVFASWHNTLVYDTDSELPCGGANYSDAVLAKLLNGIELNEIAIDNDREQRPYHFKVQMEHFFSIRKRKCYELQERLSNWSRDKNAR